MKKMSMFKKLAIVTLTIALSFGSASLLNNDVEAATVYKTEVDKPASGNIFVSVNGTYSTANESQLLNRINQIRKEACQEGIINPATGKKLTMNDYKPVKWSTTLEEYARLRAAEASVNWAHTRPNNKSTFANKVKINGYHSAENLAMGYNLMKSIEGYYSEKANWKNKKGTYGHYTSMINPNYTLVGMAGFQQSGKAIFTAMEFGVSFGTNNYGKKSVTGNATQIVEVNVNYLVKSITLSGATTVNVGSTIHLTATANMKNVTKQATITAGYTWKSSNTKVATVDANGNVKGIAAGTVTITCAASGKTATYKVTVKNVAATSVKLNATSKTLAKGKTFKLTATVAPTNTTNKKVTYKSSNTKVATVDANGNVKAVGNGTATITVTTADGSKKVATCKVTVK